MRPKTPKPARLLAAVAGLAIGCGGVSNYSPARGRHGLLVLGYDQGVTITRHDYEITEPRFAGLQEVTHCVPSARGHAWQAQRHGRAALGLGIGGGALGVGALGGLAGVSLVDRRPAAGWAVLGSGLVAAAVGLGLAIGSRHHRTLATGHAVDAVNEHNDAIRRGQPKCSGRARE